VSDDLLLDDEDLLPGEIEFRSTDLKRQIVDLEEVLKRKDEEVERSMTQLQLNANAEYKLVLKERQMVEEELARVRDTLELTFDENGESRISGKDVFNRLTELDLERTIGVIAMRFIARRVSDGEMLGEWLMKHFDVMVQTGSYATISGRIQEMLTEDESEDFQKYMSKVPIIDPLGITSKTAKLYAKVSPELTGVLHTHKLKTERWPK
jgi:CBS-domain-containing membrane protein